MNVQNASDDAEMGRTILLITVLFLLGVVAAGVLMVLLSDFILAVTA